MGGIGIFFTPGGWGGLWRIGRAGGALGLALALAWAAETRPVVGIGATRDAVLDAYGWPSGQSQAMGREIFTYPQGQVVLKNGVVERMEFSPNVEWSKPKPRPGSAAAAKEAAAPPPRPTVDDFWLASFGEACREVRARPAHLLVLFTGSDWSPPCKRFLAEVATNPVFLDSAAAEFVLLRLDFPTHTKQTPELRLQNATLRERHNVTTYPTLLLLTADGLEIARVDLAKVRPQATYAEQVLAAIAEARPKPAALMAWADKKARRAAAQAAAEPGGWRGVWRGVREAADASWWFGGGALVLLFWWLLLRLRRPAVAVAQPEKLEQQPTEATPGGRMPTPADLAGWTQERLRNVMAGLFEFEGSQVEVRSTETGAELALRHPGDVRPRVLVRCQSSAAGLAGGRSVRTLFATIVAERVDNACYVSPGGFTPEARQFARAHGMVLIGGEDLLMRMRPVPPLALTRILGAKESTR